MGMSPVQAANAHQSPTGLPDTARGKGKHTGLHTLIVLHTSVHPPPWLLLNKTAAAALQQGHSSLKGGSTMAGLPQQKVLHTSCTCAHVMAMNTSPAHSAIPTPTVRPGLCLHDQGRGCLELDKYHWSLPRT